MKQKFLIIVGYLFLLAVIVILTFRVAFLERLIADNNERLSDRMSAFESSAISAAAQIGSLREQVPGLGEYMTGLQLHMAKLWYAASASNWKLADYELRTGRAHPDYYQETLQRMAEARAAVAAVVTADVGDIALTHSTTDGMNVGVWGLDWRAGDRAVSTGLEHPGGLGALYNLRARVGAELRFVDVGPERSEDEVIEAFDREIDERTRVVAVSHVLWASGRVMPIARIAEIAYGFAERRGFTPGLELEDWLEAVRQVDDEIAAQFSRITSA